MENFSNGKLSNTMKTNVVLAIALVVMVISLVAQCRYVVVTTAEGYLDPQKMFVLQGVGLPEEVKLTRIVTDDPHLPSIDGNRASNKAMFMFAFNESGPQCCPSVLSTINGCVCVTPEQHAFIANRGISKQTPVLK